MNNTLKNKIVHLSYYAVLREDRGIAEETISTTAMTVRELYKELQERHNFRLTEISLRASIDDTLASWETEICTNNHIVFIPPVSGG